MTQGQTEFILENVRCFEGEQRAALRPITLLVGENSTGKSTLLGCFRVVDKLFHPSLFAGGSLPVNFNEEPFLMGSFRDIVRFRRGRDGRLNEFMLGIVVSPPSETGFAPYPIYFTFSESGPEPAITSYRMQFTEDLHLEVLREAHNKVRVSLPGHAETLDLRFCLPHDFVSRLGYLVGDGRYFNGKVQDVGRLSQFMSELVGFECGPGSDVSGEELGLVLEAIVCREAHVVPIAPLRSKPQRIYIPVRESVSPEGEHIPMLLMRLDRTKQSQWDSLHDQLVEFGIQSGLFSDIKVKHHGRQMTDSFQLQLKVRSGSHSSIMDVGYGVSQSLPILVDLMSASKQTFLLQQPEVHLHPRGQAELASLFVQSWKNRKNRFLIETHSDHVVDRVRISVRRGDLKPQDVSILYFEPKRNSVQIHNLSLDKQGNLLDAPPGYRDFFLRETDRLLGFRDD